MFTYLSTDQNHTNDSFQVNKKYHSISSEISITMQKGSEFHFENDL